MADIGRIFFGPGPDGAGGPRDTHRTPGYVVEQLVTPRSRARAVRESRTRLEGERQRVRIKYGWEDAGRQGVLLTTVMLGQEWAVVLWRHEKDPDCFKLAGLELL